LEEVLNNKAHLAGEEALVFSRSHSNLPVKLDHFSVVVVSEPNSLHLVEACSATNNLRPPREPLVVSAPKARPPKEADFLVNQSLPVSLGLSEQQARPSAALHSNHKVDSQADFSAPNSKPRPPSHLARACKAWANKPRV